MVRNSKNQVKNHINLYFIKEGYLQNFANEDTAVQPPIIYKKIFFHLLINGSTQERKFSYCTLINVCILKIITRIRVCFLVVEYTGKKN